MKTHWSVLILGVLVLTTACTGHGEKAAQQWLERQLASKQEILDLPRIPEVSDTLPVAYNPELYPDPFKKNLASTGSSQIPQDLAGNPRARFPRDDLMNLRFYGYIKTLQGPAAMVSNNFRSESLHVGDLIGSSGWEVISVSTSGIEVRVPDGNQLRIAYQK